MILGWTMQRKAWKHFAICLPHLLPLLCDEIEFFLCLIIVYSSTYKSNNFGLIAPLATASFIHICRGVRWQLIPIYPVIISLLAVTNIGVTGKVIYIFALLLSLALCLLIPVIPPIKSNPENDELNVGIQDIVLNEGEHSFLVRAYYPLDKTHTSFKIRPFANDLSLLLLLLTAIFGIRICDPSDGVESSVLWGILYFFYSFQLLLEIYNNAQYSVFIPEGFQLLCCLANFAKLPSIIFSHMNLIRIHCQEDAPISKEAKHILLFYPGLAGHRATHVSICMKAAAHGYFVICLESADQTPILSILPNAEHRHYFWEELTPEMEHKWRYQQMTLRTNESQVIMNFLQNPLKYQSDMYLGYLAKRNWLHNESGSLRFNWKYLLSFIFPSYSHDYTKQFQESMFWNTLLHHTFDNFEPFLVGHSFGGATVIHMMADTNSSSVLFRERFPLSGIVAHDPWTIAPITEQIKNLPNDSLTGVPLLVMHAEFFEGFKEYNIINACTQVMHIKCLDAGHHSFNELAFTSPIIGYQMKNVGKQDGMSLLYNINSVSVTFLNQIRASKFKTISSEATPNNAQKLLKHGQNSGQKLLGDFNNSDNNSVDSEQKESHVLLRGNLIECSQENIINDDATDDIVDTVDKLRNTCTNTSSKSVKSSKQTAYAIDFQICINKIKSIDNFQLITYKS